MAEIGAKFNRRSRPYDLVGRVHGLAEWSKNCDVHGCKGGGKGSGEG